MHLVRTVTVPNDQLPVLGRRHQIPRTAGAEEQITSLALEYIIETDKILQETK